MEATTLSLISGFTEDYHLSEVIVQSN